MIITELTEHIAAMVENTEEDMIVNHKAIVGMEVYFRVITKRSAIFVRS
jgi:hypothetical protein